jgi:hypothetical protein
VDKVSVLARETPDKYPDLRPFLLPPLPPLQGGLDAGDVAVGCGVAGCGGFVLFWVIALFVVFVFRHGNSNVPPGVFIAVGFIAFAAWIIWAISTHTTRTENDEKLKKSWPAAEAIWWDDVYYCPVNDIFFRGSDPEMASTREERVNLLLAAVRSM